MFAGPRGDASMRRRAVPRRVQCSCQSSLISIVKNLEVASLVELPRAFWEESLMRFGDSACGRLSEISPDPMSFGQRMPRPPVVGRTVEFLFADIS